MSDIEEFLGTIVGRVVRDLIILHHTGLRIQNVTAFDPASMLAQLNVEPRPRVAIANAKLRNLVQATKYPAKLLTADLAEATDWRNDRDVLETVLVVSFGEEERLGTFHRFTEIRDQDLYEKICNTAREEICPNNVLIEWWRVLSRQDVKQSISVQRLASYFLYIKSKPSLIPEASRDGLYLLGLLPSKTIFDGATPSELRRNLRNNRLLANRIEILNKPDRDRLSRGLDASKGNRAKSISTFGLILRYSRSGSDSDRSKLVEEDVRALFETKKGSTKSKARVIPIERAGVDAILEGDDQELAELGEKLRQTINEFDQNETPNVTIDLNNRNEQASLKIPSALIRLLSRSITPELYGGHFTSPAADDFDEALDDVDTATFTGFKMEGENSFQSLLQRVVEAGLIEPEIMVHWRDLVKSRGVLATQAAPIAISPLVALACDNNLLECGKSYLEAFEALTAALRDRYEAIASGSPQGARHLCAQLLVLDVILFETPKNVYALLSPLHPLHLWKYVRLAEQLRNDRESLSEDQKEVLAKYTEKLPHFVTALFIPEGLVSNQRPLVLPESRQIGTLPCYQRDSQSYAGTEGQERFFRILRKFQALYPHVKRNLRVCVIDPPDLAGLLEQIAVEIRDEELQIDGMHLTVLRTLSRPLSLGTDDEQLEAIASLFAAEDLPRFVLNIKHERSTYSDALKLIRQDPVHVLAIFDPSRSELGRLTIQDGGFVHPLVLPKEFKYDEIVDKLEITAAATGDLFDVYYSLQNRLNNSLTGSHFGISSSLAPNFPTTGELLKSCTWLVLGDKFVDTLATQGGHVISFEPGTHRDVIVFAESLTKFEREFDHYLRKANLDPTEESIRELLTASVELVGEGLLGLIRSDGEG